MKRREAKALGLKTYNNGKPCPRGHIGERRTDCGCCVICKNESKVRNRWNARTDIKDEHRIINKDEAERLGLIYYYTGKPCKHGHHSVRYTKNSLCKECGRLNAAKRRQTDPDYIVNYRKTPGSKLSKRKRKTLIMRCLL